MSIESRRKWTDPSIMHADGRRYVTDQAGETFVFAAKPKFEQLARNCRGEHTDATPAVSNSEIFICTFGHLWCIMEKK